MLRTLSAAILAIGLVVPAHAGTILTGEVCGNTCFGYGEGDDTPDYLGLFGPVFGDLMSKPFTLIIGATDFALTINNHTLVFADNDPHYSISFTNPLLASFSQGAAMFTAFHSNIFGLASPETQFLCPEGPPITTGVPEPSTWALMLAGFIGLAAMFRSRRRLGRFEARVL